MFGNSFIVLSMLDTQSFKGNINHVNAANQPNGSHASTLGSGFINSGHRTVALLLKRLSVKTQSKDATKLVVAAAEESLRNAAAFSTVQH